MKRGFAVALLVFSVSAFGQMVILPPPSGTLGTPPPTGLPPLGVAPTSSGTLGTPPLPGLPPIGTAPTSHGMIGLKPPVDLPPLGAIYAPGTIGMRPVEAPLPAPIPEGAKGLYWDRWGAK